MLIIPAIDLKDGCVVRLVQGKIENKKVYSKDPVKMASHWVSQKAQLLHIVDLDGALTGIPKNLETVKEIIENVSVPVEFGGGVRDLKIIAKLLDYGVFRVVLGTKAISDSAFLKKAFREFKDKIIVSIDAKDRQVLIKGWQENVEAVDALLLAKKLKETGFEQIIYTDVMKDGTLKGPNIKNLKALLKEAQIKIISSGGVSSIKDIRKLKSLEKNGLIGIIVGKALYEGKFTLRDALSNV